MFDEVWQDIARIIKLYLFSFVAAILLLFAASYFLENISYDKDDVGGTLVVDVSSNPEDADISSELFAVKKWLKTDIVSLDFWNMFMSSNSNNTIEGQVLGYWCPWGGCNESSKNCTGAACQYYNYAGCLYTDGVGGFKTDDGDKNFGCALRDGVGLYMLISISDDLSAIPDPNDDYDPFNTNIKLYRTFHIGDGINKDSDQGRFSIKKTQACTTDGIDSRNTISCNTDPSIPVGGIFFKILDSYYNDNSGSYSIRIFQGAYQLGFFHKIITVINSTLTAISNVTFNEIIVNARDFIMYAILIFIIVSGAGLGLGMIQGTVGEFAIRSFKLAIIATLLSPNAQIFFKEHLFDLYSSIQEVVSDSIFQSKAGDYFAKISRTTGNVGEGDRLLRGATSLIYYDSILNIIFSKVTWIKIISLFGLFNNAYHSGLGESIIFFITGTLIVIATILMVQLLFSAMIYYIAATIEVALLIVIFPILLCFFLFNFTKDFFQSWLRAMMEVTLIVVLLTVCGFLMIQFLGVNFHNLFTFAIKNFNVTSAPPTCGDCLQVIIFTQLFRLFIDETIPALTQSISSSMLFSFSVIAKHGGASNIEGSADTLSRIATPFAIPEAAHRTRKFISSEYKESVANSNDLLRWYGKSGFEKNLAKYTRKVLSELRPSALLDKFDLLSAKIENHNDTIRQKKAEDIRKEIEEKEIEERWKRKKKK